MWFGGRSSRIRGLNSVSHCLTNVTRSLFSSGRRTAIVYQIHQGTYTFRVGGSSRTDFLAVNVTLPSIPEAATHPQRLIVSKAVVIAPRKLPCWLADMWHRMSQIAGRAKTCGAVDNNNGSILKSNQPIQ